MNRYVTSQDIEELNQLVDVEERESRCIGTHFWNHQILVSNQSKLYNPCLTIVQKLVVHTVFSIYSDYIGFFYFTWGHRMWPEIK